MKKIVVALLALVLTAQTAQSQVGKRAYVVNGTSETLSIIDLATGMVENDAIVLGDSPGALALWDNRLYLVNSASNNIQVIDPETKTTTATIELGADNNPYGLAIAGSGIAYVSNFVSNTVFIVDLNGATVIDTITVGSSPEGVLLVGHELYVCNTAFDPITYGYGQGTVSVIDIDSRTVKSSIQVGTNPQNLALGADSLLHVVTTGDYAEVTGAVFVIDPQQDSVVDTIQIGGQPGAIAVAPNGVAYLAAGGWTDKGTVFSYDSRTHQILHGEEEPILTPRGAIDVAADREGNLYVASLGTDQVARLAADGSVLASYDVGDGPTNVLIDDRATSDVPDPRETSSLPDGFVLYQNFPNPVDAKASSARFGDTRTQITVDLHEPATVELMVYDVLGREVKRIFSGVLPGGTKRFFFDTSGLPAGVYVYRLRSGQATQIRRMTVVR